jgi:hypothetical protein
MPAFRQELAAFDQFFLANGETAECFPSNRASNLISGSDLFIRQDNPTAARALIAPRPAASPMFGQVAIELFCAAVFGAGEAIDRLMTHPDWVAFQPHPTRNLFR